MPDEGARSLASRIVVEILADHFELPVDKLMPDMQLGPDLGFDSLQMFELLVILEEGLDVTFAMEDFSSELTLQSLSVLVTSALTRGRRPALGDLPPDIRV